MSVNLHRRSSYRMLGLVGHGQFGRVYCAVHRRTGQLVAIKVLNRHRLPTHAFLQELHCLLSLNHPNIVACGALEHTREGRQLILEYCEAGTVRSLLESSYRPDLPTVLRLVCQTLAGLAHAHQQGIVHCDIKPENILLQYRQGQLVAKVSDFGIAKVAQNLKTVSSGQTGSPAYMAPERFYKQFSPASDVYAVGVLLYELVLGQRPFSGTPLDLMSAHLNRPVPVPDRLVEPLKTVVLTALAKLPARRYASAVDMLAALQALLPPHRQRPVLLPENPTLETAPAGHHIQMSSALLVKQQSTPPCRSVRQLQLVRVGTETTVVSRTLQRLRLYRWTDIALKELSTLEVIETTGLYAAAGTLWLTTSSGLYRVDVAHRQLQLAARWSGQTLVQLAATGRWCAALSQLLEGWCLTVYPLVCAGRPVPLPALPRHQARLPLSAAADLVAALPIDGGHLLAIEQRSGAVTLHILTRRGSYGGALALELPLHGWMPTEQPYRFLALEKDAPRAVLVDLKPFRVMRIGLEFVPALAVVMPWGYVFVGQSGRLVVCDRDTTTIGHIQVDGVPTALLPTSPYHLLLAANVAETNRFFSIDLRDFDLDILF